MRVLQLRDESGKVSLRDGYGALALRGPDDSETWSSTTADSETWTNVTAEAETWTEQ